MSHKKEIDKAPSNTGELIEVIGGRYDGSRWGYEGFDEWELFYPVPSGPTYRLEYDSLRKCRVWKFFDHHRVDCLHNKLKGSR